MTTTTYEGPSRVELELLLRAAVMGAPAAHGRELARKRTSALLRGLATLAATVAAYDVGLLVSAAG